MADRYDAWAAELRAGAADRQARHEAALEAELERSRARLAALRSAERARDALPAARERVAALRIALSGLRERAGAQLAARRARTDELFARCRGLVESLQAAEDQATCADAARWLGAAPADLAEALSGARSRVEAWRADAAARVADALAAGEAAPPDDGAAAERLRARGVVPAVLEALRSFDADALRDYLETLVEPRLADARREAGWRR